MIRSDGEYIRDYLYVKDAALAYMKLAECLDDNRFWGEAFNFSSEIPMTVLQMVHTIQKMMGCADTKPDIQNCATGEIREQHLSASKARNLLKWKPRYDLEAGLKETIAWYQQALQGAPAR